MYCIIYVLKPDMMIKLDVLQCLRQSLEKENRKTGPQALREALISSGSDFYNFQPNPLVTPFPLVSLFCYDLQCFSHSILSTSCTLPLWSQLQVSLSQASEGALQVLALLTHTLVKQWVLWACNPCINWFPRVGGVLSYHTWYSRDINPDFNSCSVFSLHIFC